MCSVAHEGRTNFSELQAELAAGRQDRLVFYAFDLLWRDGDLRKLPQIERKQMLSDLLGENDIGLPVIYSEHLIGDGQEMFEHAAKLNFEGIIQERPGALSLRPERGLAENQNRTEGQIPGDRFCERSNRGRCSLPWKEGRQRTGLHGQGRDRLVPNGFEPDQEAARHCGQSEV